MVNNNSPENQPFGKVQLLHIRRTEHWLTYHMLSDIKLMFIEKIFDNRSSPIFWLYTHHVKIITLFHIKSFVLVDIDMLYTRESVACKRSHKIKVMQMETWGFDYKNITRWVMVDLTLWNSYPSRNFHHRSLTQEFYQNLMPNSWRIMIHYLHFNSCMAWWEKHKANISIYLQYYY